MDIGGSERALPKSAYAEMRHEMGRHLTRLSKKKAVEPAGGRGVDEPAHPYHAGGEMGRFQFGTREAAARCLCKKAPGTTATGGWWGGVFTASSAGPSRFCRRARACGGGSSTLVQFVEKLTPLQEKILALLELPPEIYAVDSPLNGKIHAGSEK